MKLPDHEACHPAAWKGNSKRMTVMGDAWRDVLSDAGSTPAWSIITLSDAAAAASGFYNKLRR